MAWVERHGRLLLAVAAGLLTIFLVVRVLQFYDRTAPAAPRDGPAYPRIQQAAGIVDIFREIDPTRRPAMMRALDGVDLRVTTASEAPAETPTLRRAPRVEEKLRDFAAPGLGDSIAAYTLAASPARRSDTEGWPALITWRMPDGQILVMTFIEHFRPPARRPVAPPAILVGIAGLIVAGLALALGRRNTRLLHRVAAAAESFDGSPPGTIPAGTAPPDMQRLVASVEMMQRRVATLLQERSFLIGAISHDLKTYLTRVRLRAEGFPDPAGRERMASDLETMTDLIDTSLAFARGTTVTQHRNLVDLADLAAIEAAERLALGQQVVALEGMGDAMVLGDPLALRRVLANLVDNALKYGRGAVEIGVESADGCYILNVDDDGPGVSEAERAAIFSPFYRIEGSRNRRTGGSGLGLAIARQIVEAHGGTISVSKGALGGARFSLGVPKAHSGSAPRRR